MGDTTQREEVEYLTVHIADSKEFKFEAVREITYLEL